MRSAIEKVKAARSPREAMMELASMIDEINSKLDKQDSWDSWGSEESPEWTSTPRDGDTDNTDREAMIAALRERIANESDGDELRALTAQLTLLTDDGRPGPVEDPGKHHTIVRVEGDTIMIDLPPASEDRQNRRRELAVQMNLGQNLGLDDHEAIEAFAQGGPLWLYHAARDFVVTLPDAWKVAFVNDIAEDSQLEAHEVGRDILKTLEEGETSREMTLDALMTMRDAIG